MKVRLMKINNVYIIKKIGNGDGDFKINGVKYKDLDEAIFPKKPKSIKYVTNKTRVVKYGELTPDEYKKQITTILLNKSDIWEDDGYPIFDNLDDEYAYKKFVKEHPVVKEEYEHSEDCEVVEYNIQGKTNTPCIVPYRLLGEDPIKDDQVVYRYEINPYEMACEIADNLGLKQVKDKESTEGMRWSVPSYSNMTLRYLKIDGRYVSNKELPVFNGITYGTYVQCLKRYKEHYNAIKEIFDRQINIIQGKGKPVDKATVLIELNNIKDRVSKIEFKVHSPVTPFRVIKDIDDLIDRVNK